MPCTSQIQTTNSNVPYVHLQKIFLNKNSIRFKTSTYPSSCFIIMQIHLLPQTFPSLPSINKISTNVKTKSDVIRTTTPFEIPNTIWHRRQSVVAISKDTWPFFVVGFAITGFNIAFAACTCDGMGHCCWGYGVDEGSFPTAWKKIKIDYWLNNEN